MEEKSMPSPEDAAKSCVHHWMIDGKNNGVCKKCGAVKQFPSSWSPLTNHSAWSSKSAKSKNTASGGK